ncbi:MAG: hypothetical protein MJ218_01555 [Opitutales bacterium]|nr:hypothetical protein [Opitutales bacterium]
MSWQSGEHGFAAWLLDHWYWLLLSALIIGIWLFRERLEPLLEKFFNWVIQFIRQRYGTVTLGFLVVLVFLILKGKSDAVSTLLMLTATAVSAVSAVYAKKSIKISEERMRVEDEWVLNNIEGINLNLYSPYPQPHIPLTQIMFTISLQLELINENINQYLVDISFDKTSPLFQYLNGMTLYNHSKLNRSWKMDEEITLLNDITFTTSHPLPIPVDVIQAGVGCTLQYKSASRTILAPINLIHKILCNSDVLYLGKYCGTPEIILTKQQSINNETEFELSFDLTDRVNDVYLPTITRKKVLFRLEEGKDNLLGYLTKQKNMQYIEGDCHLKDAFPMKLGSYKAENIPQEIINKNFKIYCQYALKPIKGNNQLIIRTILFGDPEHIDKNKDGNEEWRFKGHHYNYGVTQLLPNEPS